MKIKIILVIAFTLNLTGLCLGANKDELLTDSVRYKLDIFSTIFTKIKLNYLNEIPNTILLNSCVEGMNLNDPKALFEQGDLLIQTDKEAIQAINDLVKSKFGLFSSEEWDGKIEACTVNMVENLDARSQYLTKDEVAKFSGEITQLSGDIGAIIIEEKNRITIQPVADSPSYNLLPPTSTLLKIDGQPISDMPVWKIYRTLRGVLGSPVEVTIQTDDGAEKEVKLHRGIVNYSIEKDIYQIKPGYFYVILRGFRAGDAKGITERLNYLTENNKNPPKGIIVDLRNNQGGLLYETIGVASIFLPREQVILKLKSRVPENNIVLRNNRWNYIRGNTAPDFVENLSAWRTSVPLVLLVNGQSASGAEFFISAYKDSKRATVIGKTTMGKGTTQNIYTLPNGRALQLTTSLGLSPFNVSIDGVGIKPDIDFEEDLPVIYGTKEDRTLKRALNYLENN